MSLVARVQKLWNLLTVHGLTGAARAIREHGRSREYVVYRCSIAGPSGAALLETANVRPGSLEELQRWRSAQRSVPGPFLGDRSGGWSDFCWAWSDRGEPAGVVWTTTRSPLLLTGPGEAVVVDLYTVPEFRGRGIGTALITGACRQLKTRGFHTAYATVEVQNTASRRAFEHSGFMVLGEFSSRGWWRRRARTARWAQRHVEAAVAMVALALGPLISAGAASAQPARPPEGLALDRYGGIKDVKVAEPTGVFARAKVGNRWVLVTPEGHPFWMSGIYNVAVGGSVDDRGGTYKQRVIAKYGDSDARWGPQQVRRLRSWGFNTIAEYANKWVLPYTTVGGHSSPWARPGGKPPWPNPEPMAAVAFIWPSHYALRNQNKRAPEPTKEIIRTTDAHYRGYRGRFPDVFDPNFGIWLAGELTIYGQHPWVVGISVDDADTLFGFGAGPDFDSGGKTNPHLGFIALITPPTQAENKELRITYRDQKVYTKHALRAFLENRYKTIAALNAAWGSTYTTWDSDGGWPGGRGLLDENGKGSWIGQDAAKLGGAPPALRTDLDDFLYELAKQYFTTVREQVKRRLPKMLYLGPTSVGSWSTPSRPQVLKAAGESVDVLRVSWAGQPDRLEFIARHAGDVPLVIWLGTMANPDSAFFRYKGGMPTQAQRGQFYEKSVTQLFETAVPATGSYPFVGFQWWEFADNWREKLNWGLVSLSDNAYDGKEAMVATGKDQWGFPVGGEERDYGDVISSVKRANFGVLNRLREALGKARQ